MQRLIFSAAFLAGASVLAASAVVTGQSARADAPASVVVDNARVRVFKTTGASLAGVAHAPGVVVPLVDGPARKMGDAYWAADAAVLSESMRANGPLVIVQPQAAEVGAAPSPNASRPGEATFVGMSFKTLFENERVTTMRARMDVDAREGVHTHASDTIVVHLSGGAIEDTANGKTTVNRWKPGDVEFEARGSSHSARNVGQAVDVVLVALKLKT